MPRAEGARRSDGRSRVDASTYVGDTVERLDL